MRRHFSIALLLLLCLDLQATLGFAQSGVSGHLEWRYGRHEAEENGEEVYDADWLTQQYSLVYRTDGVLSKGRMGNYNLALGYEWNALDGEVNGESTDVSAGKFLYEGDLLIAPGGLPFRLHIYSRDLVPSTFVEASAGGLFEQLPTDDFFIDWTVVGLNNGQQTITGFTLFAGSSSSDYEGPLKEALVNVPRLLIDYQQSYVKDLKSLTPYHYRDRNLAFVSLNKRDNWFHYRVYDHSDFINPNNDFIEKAYILGTIDHTLQRKWVRLTNWIEFSADGSFLTTSQLAPGQSPERSFDLNLFSVARRQGWEVANFTNFNRTTNSGGLSKELEVPIFATKALDPETTLRMRFIAEKESRIFFSSDDEKDRDVAFFSNRIEALQRQRWNLNGQLDLERKEGDQREGVAVRTLVELLNNRSYRPEYDLFASYSLAHFGGRRDLADDTDFWEQELVGSLETDLALSYRTGVTQRFLHGSGNLDGNVTEHIVPRSVSGLVLSNDQELMREGSVFRSTTTWFGEYRSAARLSSRLELTYDYLKDEKGAEDILVASHRLRYDSRKILVSLQNRLVMGDHRVSEAGVGASDLSASVSGDIDRSFETHFFSAWYPYRWVDASLRADHELRQSDAGDLNQFFVEQRLQYNYFQRGGSGRKLFTVAEEFEWERVSSGFDVTRTARTFTLAGEYFPTLRTLLGLRLRYRYLEPEDAGAITAYLTAGVNFEKLQISLDYAYGTREEGALVADRKEHRWEVKARKIF